MRTLSLTAATALALIGAVVRASTNPDKTPQLQTLPPLREQAQMVDAWTDERKALIPGILEKYGIDAWLVQSHAPWRRYLLRC
jgi:hypothetical protein